MVWRTGCAADPGNACHSGEGGRTDAGQNQRTRKDSSTVRICFTTLSLYWGEPGAGALHSASRGRCAGESLWRLQRQTYVICGTAIGYRYKGVSSATVQLDEAGRRLSLAGSF